MYSRLCPTSCPSQAEDRLHNPERAQQGPDNDASSTSEVDSLPGDMGQDKPSDSIDDSDADTSDTEGERVELVHSDDYTRDTSEEENQVYSVARELSHRSARNTLKASLAQNSLLAREGTLFRTQRLLTPTPCHANPSSHFFSFSSSLGICDQRNLSS